MKKLKEHFLKLVALWPETWSIPIAILAFFGSTYLIRSIDSYSGVYDLGVLQVLMITALFIAVLNGLIFLGIKFNFPLMWKMYRNGILAEDLKLLTSWQRLLLFFFLYAVLLVALIFIATALMS